MNSQNQLSSDKELLHLLSQDDRIAFEEIYKRYWSVLFDAAYRRTKNIDQCKDIVQDVFADLWKRRGKVDIENLSAYLHTAVRFQVFKLFSAQKSSPAFLELFDTITSTQYSSDHELYEKELADLYDAWILSLPEKRKMIFLMHYRDKLSTREIAERLNISQKTVQNQLGIATNDIHDKLIMSVYLVLSFHELIK
jgi:RNA polymerase sigma-70 factor (ECF subfamily)